MKKLEYSYLRTEKNNDIIIFIKVESEWLDQNIEFGFKNNKLILVVNNQEYQSEILENNLVERLNLLSTPVIFTDNEGNALAEMNLSPYNIKKNKP